MKKPRCRWGALGSATDECAAELGRMGFDPYSGIFAADDAAVARGDMLTDSTALAELVGRPLISLQESLRARI